MAVVGARARMRPVRAQRSGSIGRTLAAANVHARSASSVSYFRLLIRWLMVEFRTDCRRRVICHSWKFADAPEPIVLEDASNGSARSGAQHSSGRLNVASRRIAHVADRDLSGLNCAGTFRSPGTMNEIDAPDCGRWRNATNAPGVAIREAIRRPRLRLTRSPPPRIPAIPPEQGISHGPRAGCGFEFPYLSSGASPRRRRYSLWHSRAFQ